MKLLINQVAAQFLEVNNINKMIINKLSKR